MSIIFFWIIFILLIIVLLFNLENGSGTSIFVTLLVLLGLSVWGTTSVLQPWKVEEEISVQILTHPIDNSQIIAFKDRATSDYVNINLNSLFERVIHQSENLVVVKYKSGPYAGLYYLPRLKVVLLDKEKRSVSMKVVGKTTQ